MTNVAVDPPRHGPARPGHPARHGPGPDIPHFVAAWACLGRERRS